MKLINVLSIFAFSLCLVLQTSCDKDDDEYYSDVERPGTSHLDAPRMDRNLTYTDYDGVTFRVRFTNGGDTMGNVDCKVHWRAYAAKPSKTPDKSEMTEHDYMRVYDSNNYKTTFDEAHVGLHSRRYIYYYFECSNSKKTTETSMTYCIVKRTVH